MPTSLCPPLRPVISSQFVSEDVRGCPVSGAGHPGQNAEMAARIFTGLAQRAPHNPFQLSINVSARKSS